MGYKEFTLKLNTDYSKKELERKILKTIKTDNFNYSIINKSLDSRNKKNIHWVIKVGISSSKIKNDFSIKKEVLHIPHLKTNKKAVIVGSGPAGFFSAFVLQKAGINTIILERGSDVDKRANDIKCFEKTALLNENSNYSFGEGGAGTFSDGKLTSRSKRISKEKQFILSSYVKAGANREIEYMSHPHLGSDNLRKIVKNLRKEFVDLGGKIYFDSFFNDFEIKNGSVLSINTLNNQLEADYFIIAPGHSSYETYKLLIKKGLLFKNKNFAIGARVEHYQAVINKAQWGIEELKGVKAAEYRLTAKASNNLPVYTFCMCPGGKIVPATPYKNTNIVNGMSNYLRNDKFANAACVAGINIENLLKEELSPIQTLEWLENLENTFYEINKNYDAPYSTINDFINKKLTSTKNETSYPFKINQYPIWELFDKEIVDAITDGLKIFNKKIKGFDTGIIMGLESKTSAPIQIVRDKNSLLAYNFDNLFIVGEGSGYAGGIISSAADGIKAAQTIIELNK